MLHSSVIIKSVACVQLKSALFFERHSGKNNYYEAIIVYVNKTVCELASCDRMVIYFMSKSWICAVLVDCREWGNGIFSIESNGNTRMHSTEFWVAISWIIKMQILSKFSVTILVQSPSLSPFLSIKPNQAIDNWQSTSEVNILSVICTFFFNLF